MSSQTLPLAPDRYTGRKLGKYEVLCQLSSGGMSQIFLAFQRGLAGFRKLVVLKQILPDIKADEDIVQMFLDEAKITAAFSHPNIAQVYDLDTADGELFLAMEFVPGATLIEVARACRDAGEAIPIGLTLMAVRDTALALHYAHTFRDPVGRLRQVIHRDVAEKNIMVTYEGLTKLLDFGIAKALGRMTRTAAGKVKGTSGYMSPEQIRGEELDARSDVFSLGVVLHECLTGMRLYYDKDPEAGMLAVFKAPPPAPSEGNPQVSPELDAVVLKSLAQARDDRFTTALELARALERVCTRGEIWHPEQSAEFMQRHFDTRRRQTGELLEELRFGEKTHFGKIPSLGQDERSGTASRAVKMDPLIAPPVARRGVAAGPPSSDPLTALTAVTEDFAAPGAQEVTAPGDNPAPVVPRPAAGRASAFGEDQTVVRPGRSSRRPSSDRERPHGARPSGEQQEQHDQDDEPLETESGERPPRPIVGRSSGPRARSIETDPGEGGTVGMGQPSPGAEGADGSDAGASTGDRTGLFVVIGIVVALAVLGGAVLALRAMGRL
jgi:serine/threonine protein kinase